VNSKPLTLDQEAVLYPVASIIEPLELTKLFPKSQPLEVELGSGDGSFLVTYAALNPGGNFIGIERLLGRIRKMERKARRAGLRNLRGIRIESSYFLQYLLPPHSASALHIYFPDPWPKRKHRQHRLINESFPALAMRALVPGGNVYLRTDGRNYFEEMSAAFGDCPLFRPVDSPEVLTQLQTDFEREFAASGTVILRRAYRAISP